MTRQPTKQPKESKNTNASRGTDQLSLSAHPIQAIRYTISKWRGNTVVLQSIRTASRLLRTCFSRSSWTIQFRQKGNLVCSWEKF